MKRHFVELSPSKNDNKNERNIRARVDLESAPSPSCNSSIEFNRTPLNSNSLAEKPRRGTKRRLDDDSLSEKSSSIGPNNVDNSPTKLRYEDLWFKGGGTKSKLCDESSPKKPSALAIENFSSKSSLSSVDINSIQLLPFRAGGSTERFLSVASNRKQIFNETEVRVLASEVAYADRFWQCFVKFSGSQNGTSSSSFKGPGIGDLHGVFPKIIRSIHYKENPENPWSPIETVRVIIDEKSPAYFQMLADFDGYLRDINCRYSLECSPHIQIKQIDVRHFDNGSVERFTMLSDTLITPEFFAWKKTSGMDFNLIPIDKNESFFRDFIVGRVGPRQDVEYTEALVSNYISKTMAISLIFLETQLSFSVICRILLICIKVGMEHSLVIKQLFFCLWHRIKISTVFFLLYVICLYIVFLLLFFFCY